MTLDKVLEVLVEDMENESESHIMDLIPGGAYNENAQEKAETLRAVAEGIENDKLYMDDGGYLTLAN